MPNQNPTVFLDIPIDNPRADYPIPLAQLPTLTVQTIDSQIQSNPTTIKNPDAPDGSAIIVAPVAIENNKPTNSKKWIIPIVLVGLGLSYVTYVKFIK